MDFIGYVPASGTVDIFFTTHSGAGAAIAPLTAYEAGDVQLYKDNSATQRSSTAGWTMTSPFDSIVGLHLLHIDLSDNTDAGFYAAGSRYTAVLSADTETVDGNTVVRVLAQFAIGPVQADVRQLLGTAWLSPGTAGTPDVNVKLLGGTSQTGRDIGASVLLSAGSGTGQLDFTSGVVKANLAQILGTALTETAGQIAAGFKKFFNIATPAATMDHGILVDTVTTYTGNTPQTGDAYARLGAPAGASVSADIAAVKVDTAAVKVQTDKLTFTVANQIDANVLDWKSATAPAMTGDAYARLGAPAGASVSADVAAIQADTDDLQTRIPAALTANGNIKADVLRVNGTAQTAGDLAAMITAVDDYVDTEVATIVTQTTAASIRSAVGLASANLDTQIDALPTATENADELLKRDWTSVTGEAARSVLNALRAIRNRVAISSGTLTVYEEDDTTSAWTGAVTTASGDPVSEVDPS